jgi:hypothetical protein
LLKYLSILLLCISSTAFGQQSNQFSKWIKPLSNDTLLFDSGFVIPNSLQIVGYTSPADYEQINNKIAWKVVEASDSIFITYRKLIISITYQNKDIRAIRRAAEQNPFSYTPSANQTFANYGNLKTAGNVSRGIGFGNAQDVVVNSNLNLRLSGTLANDVEVLAVISDENNPIQPEGNTQQIQDFDQVYITLKRDSLKLTLGDFLMSRPANSYFLNYYKKSRGVQLSNVKWYDQWRVATEAEAAISRGRFSRNTIDGIEGNSGPYRLSGDNGEIFIVVIAGTENVYLDGKQLERGEDNDYVINYNTGEITFTPRILITRYSRIVAEFQYSDRNYGRSVAHLGTAITKGKFTVYANGFNEMDLRSQPFQQNLNGFDSLLGKSATDILAESGDSLAFFSNVRPQTAYNNDRIMYTRADVGLEQRYSYAANPDTVAQFYEVIFSNVGFGNGSYRQAQSAANGKVFEYIGTNAGDYDPIEVLVAPQRLNTLNLGVVMQTEGRKAGIEYTISSLDKNTLSSLDDSDNQGFGLKLFQTTNKRLKDSSWLFTSDLNYELVSDKYNYVERYRNVEFDRKWNKVLSNPSALAQFIPQYEHIANATFGLAKSPGKYVNNNTSVFYRPNSFTGFSNLTNLGAIWKKISLVSSLELLNSATALSDTSEVSNAFHSASATLSRPIWRLVGGLGFADERSAFKKDSLQLQSYSYRSYSVFIRNSDTGRLKYNLNATQRIDDRPKNNELATATIGRDINLQSSYTSKKSQRVDFNTIYRQLQIKDTTLSTKPVERTLQSRIELDFHFWKKFIRSRTFYQVGTGQEQRREFQYLQVQAGNGVYIWNDYDTNNIKTLNEFEVASDLDRARADYIKIFTPVAGFITTNSNKISQTIELNPAVFYTQKSSKKAVWARFNSLTTLILDKKILPTSIGQFLNPIQQNLTDTNLISNSQSFRSTLFYNRGNPRYGIDYTYINNNSKVLLTNGFDSRSIQDNILNTRINIGRKLTLDTRLVQGDRLYLSQFFADRSYQYQYYEVAPKLALVIKNTYRFELLTKYYKATNKAEYGGESSENIELGGTFKYTQAGKGTMNIGAKYIKVKFDGDTRSTLGYELLRGLQNGDNATWNVGYQRTLANNIQVIVSYDGRKSEDAPVIHIGRLVARYLF